jgi:NitT/TauT family transport system ATP-binding protein
MAFSGPVARPIRPVGGPSSAAPVDIEVSGVGKIFDSSDGQVTALSGVDLKVRRGEFVSLLGPSGCGKSTLLRIIAGLTQPTSGTVIVRSSELDGPPDTLGFVFQRDVLVDWRTIIDNVLLPIDFKNKDVKKYRPKAAQLLATFGLQGFENRRPWELSGGMRQRAAMCRALIDDPQLLLMDEPFGALDALTRDELNVELQELWQATGKTVVFVTHSIAEAVFLSDRVVVMAGRPGHVVETLDIDFPRLRSLDIREEPEFGRHSRHLRDVLNRNSVSTTGQT